MEVPNIPSETFTHLNHRVDYHIYRFISPNASHGGNRNAAGRVGRWWTWNLSHGVSLGHMNHGTVDTDRSSGGTNDYSQYVNVL